MDLRRTVWLALLGVVGATGATACSSRVGPGEPLDGEADARGGDGGVIRPDGGDTGVDIPYFDTNAYDVFRGNPCPGPPPAPMRAYTCDPLARVNPCPTGQSCYPFVQYPSTQCGAETYRADCMPSGTTAQDGFCRGGTECLPGLACFVTGSMNRCLRLCRLDGTPPQCARGAVCEPTDLPDFGACQ